MEDTELNKKYMELKQKVLMFEKREAELLAKENVLLQENEETQRKVGKFFVPRKDKLQSNLDYPDFFSGPVFFMNINKLWSQKLSELKII